ncbi:DUF2511 domain-containing protein [Streptomyces sp. 549]|uniref:DUF2511 domain-containing protein n=1 Tax=Streptomyces sp. 549 TaxID=3049076 RepID=UPI0024C456D1|nr:DUF2511 domain-containing protein [Streptomyces sp. 549]MDK1476060.1 DUF2511 domain-containing protein [Streptomyces sp. 549]
MTTRRTAPLVTVLLLAALTACGTENGDGTAPPAADVTPKATSKISKGDVTPWPFTVDTGTLACDQGKITFEAGGTEYGLTGSAQSSYAKPDPIWVDDPDVPGVKTSLGSLIAAGMKLCKE